MQQQGPKWAAIPPTDQYVNYRLAEDWHRSVFVERHLLTSLFERKHDESNVALEDEPKGRPWTQRALDSHLKQTFRRLLCEGKVLGFFGSDDKPPSLLLWNTGLSSQTKETVFCLMNPFTAGNGSHSRTQGPTWSWAVRKFYQYPGLCHSRDPRWAHAVKHLPPIPPSRANWTEEGLEYLVYDARREPLIDGHVNWTHIFSEKKRQRLPSELRGKDLLFLQTRGQERLRRALEEAGLNPRKAVPQFFKKKGENGKGGLQLLLPIAMGDDPRVPDCALVLRLQQGRDNYEVATILDKRQVYGNVRLIQRIDQDWLCSDVGAPGAATPSSSSSSSSSAPATATASETTSEVWATKADVKASEERIVGLLLQVIAHMGVPTAALPLSSLDSASSEALLDQLDEGADEVEAEAEAEPEAEVEPEVSEEGRTEVVSLPPQHTGTTSRARREDYPDRRYHGYPFSRPQGHRDERRSHWRDPPRHPPGGRGQDDASSGRRNQG